MTHSTMRSASMRFSGATKPPARSLLTRIEDAFVQWQAARLQEIPVHKLWAQAMQDTRPLAQGRSMTR